MSYILMWLEAPLQSWGVNSKYQRRDTLNFPSKSGIMGIILSALGKTGDQKELLSRFINTDLEIEGYFPKNKKGIAKLEDFHMVGSRYNESDPWENLLIPKTSEGKKAVGGGAKLTYRYYMQNMSYSAIVEVPDDLVDDVSAALINPVWPLFLGRKCCIPSEIIFQGKFSSKQECINKANEIAESKNKYKGFSVFQGADYELGGEIITLNDVPISFGVKKSYSDRQVTFVGYDMDEENISESIS